MERCDFASSRAGNLFNLFNFIQLLFHCAFSNVSSNCLPVMMHSHTGCICLSFQDFQGFDPSQTRNKVRKENLRLLDLSTTAGSWILTLSNSTLMSDFLLRKKESETQMYTINLLSSNGCDSQNTMGSSSRP